MIDTEGNQIFDPVVHQSFLENSTYKTATPYPHLVIDNLFNTIILDKIINEWPLKNSVNHENHNDGIFVKNKRGSNSETLIPLYTKYILHQLCSPNFLRSLEQITGIGGLIPDPYNFGGGLHETQSGGKLAVHIDYNKHYIYKLDRRINLLIYLNKNWKDEMGGNLELWDSNVSECVQSIPPIYNRTVIFSTISTAFHGQPEPVVCRADESRKSIALYYYSNGRPEEQKIADEQHSTLWKERPGRGY
jgi:Rps23 Pro-64 3,4-dihydroxylase Tpa1-like proline 4-hydroxylase